MFITIYPDNIKDDATDTSLPENEKTLTKNGIINGKAIVNANGTPNGQMIYQNGNKKSDVAVIDIVEDGKYNARRLLY